MSSMLAELIEWLAVFSMSLMGVEYSRVDACENGTAELTQIALSSALVEYVPADQMFIRFEDCDTGSSSEVRFTPAIAGPDSSYNS